VTFLFHSLKMFTGLIFSHIFLSQVILKWPYLYCNLLSKHFLSMIYNFKCLNLVVCPVKSLFLNKHVEIMILNYSQNFLFLDMTVYDKRWQRKLNMVTPVLKASPALSISVTLVWTLLPTPFVDFRHIPKARGLSGHFVISVLGLAIPQWFW
jgi:hypothetical protein